MEKSTSLTSRQLMAIHQIIASSTLEEARRRANLSKSTLYAWLKVDVFKEELKRQQDVVIGDALGRLKCAISKAVDGMIELMDNPQANLRHRVYRDIIEYAQKSIEVDDIEERLIKIEEYINERIRK